MGGHLSPHQNTCPRDRFYSPSVVATGTGSVRQWARSSRVACPPAQCLYQRGQRASCTSRRHLFKWSSRLSPWNSRLGRLFQTRGPWDKICSRAGFLEQDLFQSVKMLYFTVFQSNSLEQDLSQAPGPGTGFVPGPGGLGTELVLGRGLGRVDHLN